jgi:hypothetical protein
MPVIPVMKSRLKKATEAAQGIHSARPDTASSVHSNQPGASPWSPQPKQRERRESMPASDDPIVSYNEVLADN